MNAFNVLVPALLPIAVKLIDKLITDDNQAQPHQQNETQYCQCCCKKQAERTQYDLTLCGTCRQQYTKSRNNNNQYLAVPTNKTRSKSSSEFCGNEMLTQRYARTSRCLSDSSQSKTNDDTLGILSRHLNIEDLRKSGSGRTLLSSTRIDGKDKTSRKSTLDRASTSSFKRLKSRQKATNSRMDDLKLVSCRKSC